MSSQLEELKKLYVKIKEYKIPENPKKGESQATINITPLSLDEMHLMDMKEDGSIAETAKSMHKLIATSMGVEEQQVKEISFEYMQDITNAIMDANNFNEADVKKTGIKDFIAQKQKQIEETKVADESAGQS